MKRYPLEEITGGWISQTNPIYPRIRTMYKTMEERDYPGLVVETVIGMLLGHKTQEEREKILPELEKILEENQHPKAVSDAMQPMLRADLARRLARKEEENSRRMTEEEYRELMAK